ncbi:hypothetical protein V2J09_019004 [Rumex salicifolius]
MADNARVKFSSDEIVIKSPNDKKLYRYIVLRNGLCALLVHDPEIYSSTPAHMAEEDGDDDEDEEDEEDEEEEDDMEDEEDDEDEELEDVDSEDDDGEAEGNHGKRKRSSVSSSASSQTKKAAAAMCVGMGSIADPPEAQGLAHFLEHMLFMGSAEFPDENEYDSYLSKHGGSSNAYTETEHTCYYFDVKREFLKGALKRFSQFFISPLVKSEAMDREVLAVDSEFNQVLQNDGCRLQQLQCHTTLPGHPYNRFAWGNKKSLIDAMEKGIDLRDRILKMYNENYHGEVMKLVVIGGESLDVLEDWVLELFSDIKLGRPVQTKASSGSPIWNAGKIYRLEAVKDVNILDLSWKLPCLQKEYKKKPEDYLAHLIGHECRGSLHNFLKSKGWMTSISAGVGDDGLCRSSVAFIFNMSIHLTDSGLEKVHEIIGYVYQYLKLLRQTPPQEWIFKELQDIGNMDFRFVEEQPHDDYATDLAENLHIYPAEHVIYGEYAYKEWDKEMIVHLLNYLTPENMRIDVVSKLSDNSGGVLQEPWFQSQYMEEDVSPSLIELWRDPPKIDASLHLPSANDFIPTNFYLHADNISGDVETTSHPVCVLDEPMMKFWHMLDDTFKLPRANTYFRMTLKDAHASVESCLLTELFVNLLKDELNEIIYQASIAKLETSVSLVSDKLELKVYGFNDKLPVLLSKILTVAKSFMPTEDRFKVIKESLERNLRNSNMKPLNHASYLRLQVLCKRFYDADEKMCCLKNLGLADLQAYIPKLLSEVYIEGLCHGNMLEEDVVKISNIFKNFSEKPLPVEMRHGENILCLPPQANLVRDVPVKNKSELNSVVELYYQIEQDNRDDSIRIKALSDLFDEIVEEPLFDQLRTKEQLGYVVECSSRMTYRTFGFCFCVQSSEYDPIYLQDRIDNFISGIKDLLAGLDDESFESYKGGLIAKLLEKDPSLTYQTGRFWSQISKKEAEELKNTSKSDVTEWFNTYFQLPSNKCRRLAIRVWGCNTDMSKAADSNVAVQVIDDLKPLKMSSEFYSSIC